ncbi:M56 family metallopeptidase [Dysgonomonas sp. Marseille-P4361]|uniref:M56 family metallopeptidase n=1 Tax=Dysgonomonas sp. Marseille-P4361 TaxID=2161820 RepID=UPI000D55AD2B|nr:M56 family metallopeptidase [Dysgonomonas sp. Marseille-P4361]
MDAFLIYSLKLAVFLTVLYICVKAFLSRETFFSFNRWVLLLGVGVCLLLPLLKVTVSEKLAALLPSALVEKYFAEEAQEEAIADSYAYSETITTEYMADVAETSLVDISLSQVLLIIYLVGLFVNLFLLGRSAYLMFRLIRTNPKQDYKGYKLVLVKDRIVPFSWGQYIVISVSDFKDNPDEILTHEIAHIAHRHSLDIIFMECVLLLQWFNPAAWLLKRELKDMHEYQADMSVLESGIDTTKYQLLLVKKAVGASSYTLANSFNHSKIKKRITMMLKEKSSKWARLKLLLLLPLGALTVFAFARPEANELASSSADYESTINFEENEIVQSQMQNDNSEKGMVVYINTENKRNLLYYPIAYDEAKEGEKPMHDKFVKYMVGNKVYTREGFEELIKGKMYFKTETNIKSKDNVVLEFHCITQKSLKTPVLCMVKIEDETPFIPPAFTKDMEPILTYEITMRNKDNKPNNSEKKIVKFTRVGSDGEVLFTYPAFYDESKEGEAPKPDDFVKYVVKGKEYTRNEFEKLVNDKEFIENKEDINPTEKDILEFHCITQKA